MQITALVLRIRLQLLGIMKLKLPPAPNPPNTVRHLSHLVFMARSLLM